MDEDGEFEGVVASLYDSALNPASWSVALTQLGRWIGAEAFHMYAWDTVKGGARISLVSDAGTADVMRQFDTHYGHIDVVREKALTTAPGQFFITQDHFEDRFVRRNEWFQDFLIPNGMCWSTGGTVPVSESTFAVLAMLRAADHGRYSPVELERARRVWPHFMRAMTLFSETDRLRHQVSIASAGFEGVEAGVVMVGCDGRVTYTNRKAASIFATSTALTVRNGTLFGRSPDATGSLMAAIRQAVDGRAGSSLLLPGRDDQAPAVILTIVPMSGHVAETWSIWRAPGALIMIEERGRRRTPTARQLMALFRLSPAEAKLAKALAEGLTPEAFATESGLALPTVRTQLRKVFEKTSTSRQAELVKLLMVVPPMR